MWKFSVCVIISHRLDIECIRVDEIYERDNFFFDCTLMNWLVCISGGVGSGKDFSALFILLISRKSCASKWARDRLAFSEFSQ